MLRKILPYAWLTLVAACGEAVHENHDTNSDPLTCVAADPTLEVSFALEAEAWPVPEGPTMGAPVSRSIGAACTVDSVALDGAEPSITMTCSDDMVTDAPVTLTLPGAPADLELALSAGMAVQLDYYWDSDGHHYSGGEWLVIHDESGSKLLLAAIDFGGVSSADDAAAGIALAVDDSICENPCPAGDQSCSEPHRVALSLAGGEGEPSLVLDGSRADVTIADASYDVIVASAKHWSCLNCSSRFKVLIAARP